jgi:hypothetical protein
MSRQAAYPDRHSKRVASDAEHWHNWLERLAELRRASEGDEARGIPRKKAMRLRLQINQGAEPRSVGG